MSAGGGEGSTLLEPGDPASKPPKNSFRNNASSSGNVERIFFCVNVTFFVAVSGCNV